MSAAADRLCRCAACALLARRAFRPVALFTLRTRTYIEGESVRVPPYVVASRRTG